MHTNRRHLVPAFLLLAQLVAVRGVFAQNIENLPHERPVGLMGAITATLTGYDANGIEKRREPLSWTIAGAPTLSFYGIQMPFSFILSEQERSFRQPFNQFGISPTYKSITAHLGYRSMTLSRYSLAGVTFLGAGLEANPSIIRFGGMYGRLQRAVLDTTGIGSQPAYERFGYAAKLGLGNEESFVDLIYFHAKDDSNSLHIPLDRWQLYPEENAVLCLNGHVTIAKPLIFNFEGSASGLTRDLRAPAPLNNNLPGIVSKFLDVKTSTSVSFATRADLLLYVQPITARLGYERIEPDYTSLGAYYFNTDIERYTLAPALDLFSSQLRLAGSIGLEHDNVLHNKLSTTSRIIGSGSLNWNPMDAWGPGRFGIDAQYANYSTDQASGSRPINDSIRVRNISESASLSPRYMILGSEVNHVFSLTGTLSEYTDLNAFTNLFSNSKSATVALSYNLSMLKSGRSIGATLLVANTQTSQISTHIVGGSVTGSMNFFEKALTLGATLGYTQNSLTSSTLTGLSTAGTFNQNLSAAYRITAQDGFTLSLFATENTRPQFLTLGTGPYQEVTAILSYTRSFSF